MTYRQLIEKLGTITSERLDDNVTAFDPYAEEFIPIIETETSNEENDILDKGHFYLIMKA
jgi:hypothetical protein